MKVAQHSGEVVATLNRNEIIASADALETAGWADSANQLVDNMVPVPGDPGEFQVTLGMGALSWILQIAKRQTDRDFGYANSDTPLVLESIHRDYQEFSDQED